MRRAAKVDDNHKEIVNQIRDCGYPVLDLAGVGGGCPDIAVANIIWYFFEIKRPERRGKKNEFTPAQVKFKMVYGHYAPIYTIYSLDDALMRMGVI